MVLGVIGLVVLGSDRGDLLKGLCLRHETYPSRAAYPSGAALDKVMLILRAPSGAALDKVKD